MNQQAAKTFLKKALTGIYESRESSTISGWVLEKITGLTSIDRLVHKDLPLTGQQEKKLHEYLGDLLAHRPVQYVLEEAHFYGLKFFVNENVLIPRPETEELVEWILQDTNLQSHTVFDIGTGSGCIAITLKSKNKALKIAACDISVAALSVASVNAAANKVDVEFLTCDILDPDQTATLPVFDIIVSNPPYIPESGKHAISPNVLNYEPHTALFTPEEDQYLFYRAIGSQGRTNLAAGGKLYFEIHEEGAEGVTTILEQQGYKNIRLKKRPF
jgi:release factor glutamine methyltransferase